ncbi:MAG: hypothetical protein COA42_18905 [Alteromonadaceae bacterium]|nr:MAG: hypothetical protein COA42_18905 [Alteromonadaceae bacterium]
MSLLDDLKGIDLSTVVNGRVEISASLSGDDMQALIGGEGIAASLSELGETISALKNAQQDPQALLEPLVAAIEPLLSNFDTSDLDLAEFIEIVREGAQIVTQVFTMIGGGDPSKFSIPGAGELGDVLNHTANFNKHFSKIGFGDAGKVKSIIDQVEEGFPSDPQAFAEQAVDLLIPFSVSNLVAIRSSLTTMIDGASNITIDTNINSGMLASMTRLRIAAEAKNLVAVNQELKQLSNIRNTTLNSIRTALRQTSAQINALNIEQHIATIESFADSFQVNPAGALEFLQNLENQFKAMRNMIEGADFPDLTPILDDIVVQAEALLRANVEAPIDKSVEDLKNWLRSQLAHLNLRYYRGLLTQFFRDIEKAIRDANIDGPARDARIFLDELEAAINNFNLGAEIQDSLGEIGTTIGNTVTTIQNNLQNIVTGVNTAAASAQAILDQVVVKLEEFQQAIDGITQTVEQLGIEQARDAVIAAIEELKTTAETVLGIMPLPDAMRPMVEGVIRELDKIDLNEVLAPIHDALGRLSIPDTVLAPINEVLQEAEKVIQNLITDELINSLEAEFQNALSELNKFDPANLLSEVTDYFDEAADFVEGLDPRPIVADIRGPYDAVLQAVDAAHPKRVLRPVIEAYEGIFSALEMPDPSEALAQLNNTVNDAAEGIGQALTQPLSELTGQPLQAAPESEGDQQAPQNGPPPSSQPSTQGPEVRPGDIIRLLGHIPNKLREAVNELEAGPAGEVMEAIASLCSGLALQLRQVQQDLWLVERRLFNNVEAILKPLSSAQMQAQLALQANFSAEIEAGEIEFDLQGSAMALGSLSAGAMRRDLQQELAATRQSIATVIGSAGGSGGAFMDRLAGILENCALANIGDDLEAFLAALDPEPLAEELDKLAVSIINLLPQLSELLDETAMAAINRLMDLIQQFSPVAQGLKFLSIFEVVQEELALLNPRRLAAELGEIHGAIREIILAYDPAIFAEEMYDVLEAIAAQIRALDPGELLGDISHFDDLSASLEALSPATALASIDGSLDEVGARLGAINIEDLLSTVNDLPPRIGDSVDAAGLAVIDNLKALLESIKYFSGIEVSVSVEVSTG